MNHRSQCDHRSSPRLSERLDRPAPCPCDCTCDVHWRLLPSPIFFFPFSSSAQLPEVLATLRLDTVRYVDGQLDYIARPAVHFLVGYIEQYFDF